MATTGGKPETKQESKPEAKPESKEVEENQEPPLKYKTWVLKVSIHCEACKRKVEKALREIDGVYEIYSDLKQHKVTIKANLHLNVEILIKKLVKKGRHAELWPEQKEKNKGKSKSKDKQGGQANSEEACNHNHGGDKEKENGKIEISVHQDTAAAKNYENGGAGKNAEGCNFSRAHEGGAACKNEQVKQILAFMGSNQPPVADKSGGDVGGGGGESEGNAGEKSGGGGGGGGGGGSKKKKKKGKKGNANVNFDEAEHSTDAGPASIGSQFTGHGPHGPVPMPSPANHSPPRQHHMYEYPTYYQAPPVYITSHNTAYPSSYSASYFASPPPYSYAYMHPGHMGEHLPSDSDTYSSYSSHPSNSFEIFSDENPNACSIM